MWESNFSSPPPTHPVSFPLCYSYPPLPHGRYTHACSAHSPAHAPARRDPSTCGHLLALCPGPADRPLAPQWYQASEGHSQDPAVAACKVDFSPGGGAGLHRVSRSGQGLRWRGILEGFWAAVFGSLTHRRGGGSLWLGVTSD